MVPDAGSGEHDRPLAASTEELFRRFQRDGDVVALEASLFGCAAELLGAARRLAGRQEADDLLHDCFLIAIRRAREFRDTERLMPWLIGILRNRARTRHRRRWRRPPGDELPPVASDLQEPSTIVDRNEWRELVVARIRELPEHYRLVVESRVIGGERLVDIAARLGTSASTVRTRFERGIEDLRRRLPAPLLGGLAIVFAASTVPARGGVAASPAAKRWRRTTYAAAAFVVLAGTSWLAFQDEAPSPSAAANRGPSRAPAVAADVMGDDRSRGGGGDRTSAAAPPTFAVQLRYPNGEPASGVPVILDPRFVRGMPVARSSPGWRVQATGPDGRAHFDGLEVGEVALRVSDRATLWSGVVGDTPIDLSLVVSVHGWVRLLVVDPDDRPIGGASLHLCATDGKSSPGHAVATTDADGSVQAPVFQPTSRFWVSAPSFVTSNLYVFDATRGGAEERTRLRLGRSDRQWRGVVSTADAHPIADGLVVVWSDEPEPIAPTYRRTDADGRFVIDGRAGQAWSAAAWAPGHACSIAVVEPNADFAVMRLSVGATVAGRIEQPAATGFAHLRVVSRRLDAAVSCALEGVGATVAADGTFALGGLMPGRHEIVVFDGGSRPAAKSVVDVVGGERQWLDLAVAARDRWPVHVLDSRGEPIVGCLVCVQGALDAVGHRYTQEAATGRDGVAHLQAERRGRYRVSVRLPTPAGIAALPCLHMVVDAPTVPLRIEVPDGALTPARVRGVIPAALRELPAVGFSLQRPGAWRAVDVDVEGRFELADVPPGDYQLWMSQKNETGSWWNALATLALRPAEDHDVGVVGTAPRQRLRISMDRGSALVPLQVELRDANGRDIARAAVAPGDAMVRELFVGRYELAFPAADGSRETTPVDIDGGSPSEVVLPRTAGRRCRIEVRSEGPLATSTPILVAVGRSAVAEKFEWVVERNLDPLWRLDLDLTPGVYELEARSPAGGIGRGTLVVRDVAAIQTFGFSLE